jgi:glycosyltransferase involved in cell wall biosynthesis
MKINLLATIKNEEKNIPRFLEHASKWADYIYIYDDGSKDGTLDILDSCKAVSGVIRNEDRGEIRTEGRDRQMLFDLSRESGAEWTMFLDADEILEDRFITEKQIMMNAEDINCYYFHMINFWRSETHYRVDELWNLGYPGKMFRNFPNLKMYAGLNHQPMIPINLPGASPWYKPNEKSKISDVNILHYGFVDYSFTVYRAYRYMVRDPLRIDEHGNKHGGYVYYERMIDETGLELKLYENS